MKKIVALVLLVTTIGFAQETIKKDLGSFDEIKVFNGLNVTLKKDTKNSIEITGYKADEVMIKNMNGRLKLSMQFPETFNAKDVEKIVIHYSNNLSVLDANEGSYIGSNETIKQEQIDLKTQEGAIIDLDIDIQFLEIKSVTGGTIIVSGTAKNQNIEATTGGSYKAYDLTAVNTTALAASGALVRVKTSELLDARVRFGGTIYYKGNPKEVKKKKIIGGIIQSKD